MTSGRKKMAASYVTAEQCKLWEKSGKQEFLKFCNNTGDKTVLASIGNRDFRQGIYELCFHVVRGHLKHDQAVAAFLELKDQFPDFISLVADTLGLIDVELSCTDDGKPARERFLVLIQHVGQSLDCEALFKSRFDHDTLENASLISNKSIFTQRHVKIKTRLYYKQQKFNLLREESEGYSKLITELNQEITDKLTPECVLQNIKSLIGCFNLDPNRVIDILLESFENHPDREDFYVPLIKSYMKSNETLCHILGFKFQFFMDDETPASLFKLAALLLKNDLVQLDTLYPHLFPSDNTIIEHNKKEMADAKTYARKLTVVNLSDKANEDKKNEEAVKVDPLKNNQKLGLVEALLGIGAWDKSKCILDRLPEFFGTTYKPVASALCALIHTVLDPVYRKHSGMSARIISRKGKVEPPGCSVQRATTFKEVYSLVYPMVTYLGPYAECDPILLVKLVRLGKTFMNKRNQGTLNPDDQIMYYGLLSILDEVILPSMSFLTCNCCIADELWGLVKLFPYELRYRMYGNWKNDMYLQHPRLVRVRADCIEKAKYIMKRLAKENVKPSGRQLGKLSHSNPGVMFEYVIKQIERYDNLIGPVVDSLKYLSNLSYDILVFSLIESVANPEKEKMKFDDTSLSLWLQSLANFAGSICKKYQVDLAGLLQYVTNQLKAGKSIDLLLMREIVQKMAGIEVSEEITSDQLEAMSGGELLKQEGGYFTQVRNTKKSSNRLKDTVLENDLALSLCLLISQQRDAVIYKEGSTRHLKLVGKLYDQCQDTLVQFGSFLSMQLSTEEFVRRLPPIDKMVSEYHVPADAAFFLSRPLYSYEVNAKFDELRKAEKMDKDKKATNKVQKYLEASEIVMGPVIECVRPLQTAKIWEDLSPTFYVTFWALSMYDIHVPSTAYEKQVAQLTSQISGIEDNKDLPQSKRKKEKDRCNQLMDKLKEEEKKQTEHVQRVLARLKNEKETWFVSRSTKNETITQFLQLCIFPRCCFTANDSVYCAKFIHILHNLKTPNFSTLICYDRIFNDITYTVSSCTENEAHRYGRFLCCALETVMRWHGNKSFYDKECGTYPGFVTVFRKGDNSNNKADQLDFENYRHVCHKWHFRITKSMVACIESGNYIQTRNALIILTKILPHYPRIIQFGSPLERRVDRLRQEEKDKRPDLYALAMGYSGQLKSKKGLWVNETDFHLRDKEKKSAASSSTNSGSSGADNSGSKGDKDKTKLLNGDSKPSSAAKDTSKVIQKVQKMTEKIKAEAKALSQEVSRKSTESERKDSSSSSSVKVSSVKEKEKKEKERPAAEKEKTKERTSADADKNDTSSREERSQKKDKATERSRDEKASHSAAKDDKVVEKAAKSGEKSDKGKERKEGKVKVKDKGEYQEVKVKEEKTSHAPSHPRLHRDKLDKSDREEIKVEKDSKKDEKIERIKLKRGYVATGDDHPRDVSMEWEERGVSVTSSGSGGQKSHHSPEESPRNSHERDTKRRKTDVVASTSKEDSFGSSKSRHRKSTTPEKERDRKEKKRLKKEARAALQTGTDSPQLSDPEDYAENDVGSSSSKKRRSVDPPTSSRSSSKMNGDSDDRVKPKIKEERHYDDGYGHSSKDDRYYEDGYAKPSSSRKEPKEEPEESHSRSKDRTEKKKDRSSSGKRSKKS